MASSLFTALSGLHAHETWISIIGNNLANASTPGFKSSRATFSDQLSQTLRFARGASGGSGGLNPMQIGLGVTLADIGRSFEQGALTATGRTLDLALDGGGLFALSDGTRTFFTRVGTFGLDGAGNLVDQRTGHRVLGLGGQPITLDTTSPFPPQASGEIVFAGNLPAQVTGPLAEVLAMVNGLQEGTPAAITGSDASDSFAIPVGETWTLEVVVDGGAPQRVRIPGRAVPYTAAEIAARINAQTSGVLAGDRSGAVGIQTDELGDGVTLKILPGAAGADLASLLGLSLAQVRGSEYAALATTDLNQLAANAAQYQAGDVIQISGTDADGSAVSASFVYGAANDGTTVADLVAFIDAAFAGSTASFDAASGAISLAADTPGVANLALAIGDGPGAGSTDWSQHAFAVSTDGTGPDRFDTSIEVFDSAGASHAVTLTFERQSDGTWTVIPSSADGTVSGTITGLAFAADGSISALPSSSTFSVQFAGQGAQTVSLDLGTLGGVDGVTQFGQSASVYAASQDGYGAGELDGIAVERDGTIEGSYSNGQTRTLGELGIATFANEAGLREIGDNLWVETANSGTRTIGAGNLGRAGKVVGGALEASNVSVAEELVHLIEAQRGFQANARVITATDEVLAEVVNLR
jgi:flagellar hook protein FlgE